MTASARVSDDSARPSHRRQRALKSAMTGQACAECREFGICFARAVQLGRVSRRRKKRRHTRWRAASGVARVEALSHPPSITSSSPECGDSCDSTFSTERGTLVELSLHSAPRNCRSADCIVHLHRQYLERTNASACNAARDSASSAATGDDTHHHGVRRRHRHSRQAHSSGSANFAGACLGQRARRNSHVSVSHARPRRRAQQDHR